MHTSASTVYCLINNDAHVFIVLKIIIVLSLEGQKRHVSVENQSDEVDGLGSVSVWSGGMDIKEIG